MAIKLYKPTTPARRHTSVVDYSELTKKRPEKGLSKKLKTNSGRNAQGKITIRHRQGGAKKLYRAIDFKRDKWEVPGLVKSLEYDPNRSAFIALVTYPDGEKRYIIAPEKLKVGQTVVASRKAETEIKLGNHLTMKHIPVGTFVHNIELTEGQGGQIVRSAGSGAMITAKEGEYALLRLPSGEIRRVSKSNGATIGTVSNSDHNKVRLGLAGRKRRMGWRPQVLGKSMNPCDHPHGGGEGHSPIGLKHPKTPWGKPALGPRTRRKNKYSDRHIIKSRRKK
ncbi:50S ribosomal protein L2 [Patescibacteria group bacterium]